jgi:Ribosomal prokaryotic L21 protein
MGRPASVLSVLLGVCWCRQIFKHKPKKHYQRKTGHRQPLTKFQVTKISIKEA